MEKIDAKCEACQRKALWKRGANLLQNMKRRKLGDEKKKIICLNCGAGYTMDDLDVERFEDVQSIFE